jgi:ribosomal protein S18 acetylase RimI-like enzyme
MVGARLVDAVMNVSLPFGQSGASTSCILRRATQEDLPAVYDIYMHPAVIPFLGVDPMDLDSFASVYAKLLDPGRFCVVERSGRILAFCRIDRHSGRMAHVATIGPFAVAPELHGSGLADDVLTAVLDLLADEGVLRTQLFVEADNARGFKFYLRHGFVQEGVLIGAYIRSESDQYVDELLMAKLLPPLPA